MVLELTKDDSGYSEGVMRKEIINAKRYYDAQIGLKFFLFKMMCVNFFKLNLSLWLSSFMFEFFIKWSCNIE